MMFCRLVAGAVREQRCGGATFCTLNLKSPLSLSCESSSPISIIAKIYRFEAILLLLNGPYLENGVKAGMFVRDAKARCPHLVIVPYNFEAYEEVADQFCNILHKHCDEVQAVSCDEAFLDITGSDVTDPEILVSEIRKEILESTCGTASAGILCALLLYMSSM
ncbi:hypothetical protein BVRB_006700 isoform B [Beta vulgaris subsp. vulgaris]|uniref:UmuC domain-containing protein n=1 Tax=Beta vulgaris subsp. vulgaris TaxID=3555 RepID=A0A0J8B3P4_BETVV|nr:DNA repair protein REV1 isoform X2 [Beta vulgaris subsp. vulgaris]KMS95601.1 hypothetical protein BVRB_006700 isoform B [Beta vulgaris subsp. vulgaris]